MESVAASFEALSTGVSGDPELERQMLARFGRAFALWCERHRKYGRGNIGEFGAVGCLIRAADKKARLREHYLGKVAKQFTFQDETVADSWIDMLNYAAMGLICHEGDWPGVGKDMDHEQASSSGPR